MLVPVLCESLTDVEFVCPTLRPFDTLADCEVELDTLFEALCPCDFEEDCDTPSFVLEPRLMLLLVPTE